jgi:hypothetical protein
MRIVAHLNDGKGLITNPVILIEESEFTTAEQHLENIPANLNPTIFADRSSFPDIKYHQAWTLENSVLGINITIAQIIFKDKIRALRTPLLSNLDIAFQRALETGADTKDIVAQKQALRDAPEHPSIETATTTAELDALITTIIPS